MMHSAAEELESKFEEMNREKENMIAMNNLMMNEAEGSRNKEDREVVFLATKQ